METFDNNKRQNRRLGWGIFLLVLGAMFLMKNIGLFMPFWVLSWHTILLALGLWFGYRKNFRAGGWVVMVLIGGIFTLRDVVFFDISSYTTALVLIGLGLYLILKPKKEMHFCDFGNRKSKVNFEETINK
jgi:predicted membrane protein